MNHFGPSVPSLHTRSDGKAKKTKDRESFYKGYGVVYLPGDINGLAKKLHLLLKSFKAGLQNRQYNVSFKYFNQSNCRNPRDVIEAVATGKNKNADIICKHGNKRRGMANS